MRQMEQVDGQQAPCRVCVAWYETSQRWFPSPPSFTGTGSLCRPCHNIKPPQTFSSRKLFFSAAVCVCFFSLPSICSSLQRTNSYVGELCQRTSRHFSCYWCTIWLQEEREKNSLITITISDQNSAAALRRSWKRWQTNKGRQEGAAKRP